MHAPCQRSSPEQLFRKKPTNQNSLFCHFTLHTAIFHPSTTVRRAHARPPARYLQNRKTKENNDKHGLLRRGPGASQKSGGI